VTKPRAKRRTKAEVEEFDKFEALTKALVSVPKKEIDKERAKANGKRSR